MQSIGATHLTFRPDTRDTSTRPARLFRRVVQQGLGAFGYRLVRTEDLRDWPKDFDQPTIELVRAVRPYTMTSMERIFAVQETVNYLERCGIPGAIVECGVWKGGSMMAAAITLLANGCSTRDLFLYDTFAGMTPPDAVDVNHEGERASDMLERHAPDEKGNAWCLSTLSEVTENLRRTGYPAERLRFIEGPVESTLPATMPAEIALLRLDTDWYKSTAHELEHLFPRIVHGGVLIVDDYGYWKGSRRAVDEYIQQHRPRILLTRLDDNGRLAVVLKH